jgi:hypothetical protein
MAGKVCVCQACQTQLRVPNPRSATSAGASPALSPAPPARRTIWDELSQAEWDRIEGRIPQKPKEDVEESPSSGAAASWGVSGGLWRDGQLLVVAQGARFPDRCVKTNQRTTIRVTRRVTWFPGWVWVLLFLTGYLPYLIAVAMLTRKLEIDIPVSRERIVLRRILVISGSVASLLGCLLFAGMLPFISGELSGVIAMLVAVFGITLLPVGLVVASGAAAFGLRATLIDEGERHAWVKGVHPDFLSALPVWPG